MKNSIIYFEQIIPNLAKERTLVRRSMVSSSIAYKEVCEPHVVKVKNDKVYDLSAYFNSTSELINKNNVVNFIKKIDLLPEFGDLTQILENSIYTDKNNSKRITHFYK